MVAVTYDPPVLVIPEECSRVAGQLVELTVEVTFQRSVEGPLGVGRERSYAFVPAVVRCAVSHHATTDVDSSCRLLPLPSYALRSHLL